MSSTYHLNEEEARQKIVKWGKEMYIRGLINGSGGNISIRMEADTVLSTPSGWSLGHLTPESISKTTIKGELIKGLKPTKELPLHLAVYEARLILQQLSIPIRFMPWRMDAPWSPDISWPPMCLVW